LVANCAAPRKQAYRRFTVQISEETASKLEQIAEKLDSSRSHMAAQAIDDYVARQEWQIAEIEEGLAEADRGEFASDEELGRSSGNTSSPLADHEQQAYPLDLDGGSTKSVNILPRRQQEPSHGLFRPWMRSRTFRAQAAKDGSKVRGKWC
jgi:predicted transcriptional regulator